MRGVCDKSQKNQAGEKCSVETAGNKIAVYVGDSFSPLQVNCMGFFRQRLEKDVAIGWEKSLA